ncbi:hypothetical protein J3458_011754 [Metarhizium acridum]|uniref:uncharacterized protein n=1 Tax=Metarhizium acridum TaxID=92637 RepID=UPI001C6D0A85|nr:hypothetical protein J3458_011754 [Metarhizium acridum]
MWIDKVRLSGLDIRLGHGWQIGRSVVRSVWCSSESGMTSTVFSLSCSDAQSVKITSVAQSKVACILAAQVATSPVQGAGEADIDATLRQPVAGAAHLGT